MINRLCSPAVLYLGFSLIQIVIDISKQEIDKALIKFIIMNIFTLMLNLLCDRGLTAISWMVVFIPFISMTIITTLILYVFSLSENNLFYPQNNNLKYGELKSSKLRSYINQEPTPDEINHYNK